MAWKLRVAPGVRSIPRAKWHGARLVALFALATTFACGGSVHSAVDQDASSGPASSPPARTGEVGCGAGQVCSAGRVCCLKSGGAVSDPSTCPCPGMATAVVGTACEKSCPGTPQVCSADIAGKNNDCLNGLQCNSSDSVQGLSLSTCSAPGSSSSSSGGGAVGACQDPAEPCPGVHFACSSALSCAPGEVCCEIVGSVCNENCSDNGPTI